MNVTLKYICMPMAIKALKHNRKLQEENLKISAPYLSLNDSITEQLEKDFYLTKEKHIIEASYGYT